MLSTYTSPHFNVRGFLFILLMCMTFISYGQETKEVYQVLVKEKAIVISKANDPVLRIDSISFNHVAQSSQRILTVNSDSLVIQLHYSAVPEFNMINGSLDHDVQLVVTQTRGSFHISADPQWAGSFTIHLADLNDHFFGLTEGLFPDNSKSPDLRGKSVTTEVNGEMYGIHENFASVWSSFYFNPKGYASFINSFARGRYQLALNGQTTIYHDTGKLDWYIFTGDHFKIYKEYYQLIGKPKFVPLWACGPTVWRDENKKGSAEILDDAKQFSDLKIPLSCLMVDRPYSNGAHLWSKMDFSSKFSDPGKWIKELNMTYGMELLTWIAPATFADKDFPGLLQGSFGYLDLSDPSAVTEFGKRLKVSQYIPGVKGHKMDRADEVFPQGENWYDHTPETQRKNKYVYLYAKVVDSVLKDSWGKDQLNYARAAYQGCQQYLSGVWGGDSRASWDGMAANMANALRASYMGFSNWGTDVGGYLGPTGQLPDDLYIRWLQWGAFNGIYEIKIDGPGGSGEDRAPWHCSAAVQDAFKNACVLRMDWLPHIYSQLNSAEEYGTLMKPLAVVYPHDSITYPIWDQYIFGNSVMVAPVFGSENKRTVYFPEGEWIDYYTLERFHGKQSILVEAPLTHIPLYIKNNSFRLAGNIYTGNQKVWNAAGGEYYVDVYFYPGTGKATIDYVDPAKNNEAVHLAASSTEKMISMDIPGISYPGKIKVLLDKKPEWIKVDGKKRRSSYKKNYLEFSRVPKTNLHVEIKL